MPATTIDTLKEVAEAIRRLYDIPIPLHVEYPGYIAIPELCINDDTDDSDAVWAVGPSLEGDGAWTGQLMTADGSSVINNMTFAVYPESDSPDDIASAVYCHGIGDWYVGGGCSDCPVRKPRA